MLLWNNLEPYLAIGTKASLMMFLRALASLHYLARKSLQKYAVQGVGVL